MHWRTSGWSRATDGRVEQELADAVAVRWVEELLEPPPDHVLGGMTEQALDRGALIADGAVRPDHGDQVARVAHERAEARLAAAAVHLLGERGPRERKRDLRGERPQRCTDGLGRIRTSGHEEKHPLRTLGSQIEHQHALVVGGELERGEHLGTQPHDLAGLAGLGGVEQRSLRPLAGRFGHGADSRDEVRPRHGAGGRQRDLVDLLAARRGHQVAARGAQHPLPLERALLLAHEPGHSRYDEAEQHDGGRTDHREVVVAAPQVVDDADRRRDQRRAREQTQAESRQHARWTVQRADRSRDIEGWRAAAPQRR